MLRVFSSASIQALASDQTSRSLLLRSKNHELALHIPADLWLTAERVKDELLSNKLVPIEDLNEIELLLEFLRLSLSFISLSSGSFPIRSFVKLLFITLHVKYLGRMDPHTCLRQKLEIIELEDALRVYYEALDALDRGGTLGNDYRPAESALLSTEVRDGRAKPLAIFGGQGNTENLMEELVDLDRIYRPLCREFFLRVTSGLQAAAQDPISKDYMALGFDIVSWVDNAESRPPRDYLFSAAVCLPLVGLIQLMNYHIMCRILSMSPGALRSRFIGATGHSQGIVAAAVMSLSETEADLVENTKKAIETLFWIGLRAQQAYPVTTLSPTILADSLAHGEGRPTPMLALFGITLASLQTQVDVSNKFLAADQQIEIALHNGPRAFVCSGPPKSLYGLNLLLRKIKADNSLDQTRIPFSDRKIKFNAKFLPISSPFHSSYLEPAVAFIHQDIARLGLNFEVATKFPIPIISTDDSRLMEPTPDLMANLVTQICVKKLAWLPTVTRIVSTHILDFGPGHKSGIGSLTQRNLDGLGVQILLAGTIDASSPNLRCKKDIFEMLPASVKYAVNWGERFKPRLVLNRADGKIYVDTKFSRLLGKQPLMVAGMTPTTADGNFVAACINAGYHVELAGGGHYNERALRDKISYIMDRVAPGQGISINVLYINPKQWGFQFPLAQVLRSEGVPIEGFTAAAGIPSLDAANEIIKSLHEAGIRYVSFKPGSVDGILQVVNIAKQNPSFPIVLQWTGGRAGGHHSFEDFHQPMLDTYPAIRSCDNITLVAGSGFGDGDETFPYLYGTWSLAYEYPAMPFDGILFGSRMMVALESGTSLSVKQTIVDAAGITDESQWVKSYKVPVGGVVTVISELGEPIHKIATRGIMLWKEFDETVFKLPVDKRVAFLRANKASIMKKLNDDFQRVWFGKKADGSLVDLHELTYDEVLQRLAELLYVRHQNRWIDKSYRRLFFDFFGRVEERLCKSGKPSLIPSDPAIDPVSFLEELAATSPLTEMSRDSLMSSEDCLYFIALCRRLGQKPVPFIPVLDKAFETWFKKDSLWQSEDIEAVVGADAGRVCILQGPVAVRHCTKVDEPIKDILDNIAKRHIELITEKVYDGDSSNIPSVAWFGPPVPSGSIASQEYLRTDRKGDIRSILVTGEEHNLPTPNDWTMILSGGKQDWLMALLLAEQVLQGRLLVPNTISSLFAPRVGWTYKVSPTTVEVIDTTGKAVVEASISNSRDIKVTIIYSSTLSANRLDILLTYDPSNSIFPIHEVVLDRTKRVKEFYWHTWFPTQSAAEFETAIQQDPLLAVFKAVATTLPENIQKFCRIVGNCASAYSNTTLAAHAAPMDFAIVVAWESVIKCLFPAQVDGDLLKLVHLSNAINYIGYCEPIAAGDVILSEARITSIQWTPTGKVVEVAAISKRESGESILSVVSKFMFRGSFSKSGLYFERKNDLAQTLVIASTEDLAVFNSKPWIQLQAGTVQVGSQLLFELEYFHQQNVSDNSLSKIQCTGKILMKTDTKEYLPVGKLSFVSTEPMKESPVLHYLNRHSDVFGAPSLFDGEGIPLAGEQTPSGALEVTTNSSNQSYSDISGDHNPIHTSQLISRLAGLPGTITHGMWTSAAVRSLVETHGAENQPLRVRAYDVTFDAMVLPKDKLQTRLRHIGMRDGRKLIKIETVNQHGVQVLHGTAEVDQPRTAFVFTGQGSQEPKMGMDLYETSAVARGVWDRADKHFFTKYGFSILDIVRNNPKTLVVYFGGPGGQAIKQNYQDMVYETGSVSKSLFPLITKQSGSYTFTSPKGLLSATQFTQPALTLMEMAAFEDMRQRGLTGPRGVFAGHSLGEYAALASVGEVLSIETLCDIVFYRGLTMQVAVARDSNGRSDYGMIAVNPGRVGCKFDDKLLRSLVPQIATCTGRLLEIVNFNVENFQYVVAGELVVLDTLSDVLSLISKQKMNLANLMHEHGRDALEARFSEVINKVYASCVEKATAGQLTELTRGVATIPLPGIDVPFHSSFLLGGVNTFRNCLDERIKTVNVDVGILRGKYVPNLTGIPFDTTLEYVEFASKCCNSVVLKDLVESWGTTDYSTAGSVQNLARTLLIELLAFQFASPVRWIETQDVLFTTLSIERLIEIGPSPVLIGMAERTLKIKYQEYDDALNMTRTLWSYSKNRAEINYEDFEAVTPTAPIIPASAVPMQPVGVVVSAPVSAPAASAGPAQRHETLPFDAEEFLRIIVAIKSKKTVSEVAGSKSIKEISAGKSTLQNEIIADLQKEFGDSFPERSEEVPLSELATMVKPMFNKVPGKYSTSLIGKLFSSKMPAGVTVATAKEVWDAEFGVGAGAVDLLLTYSLMHEPATRLVSADAAREWMREVASIFFSSHSMALPAAGGASAGGGGAVATISSAELDKVQAQHKRLIKQQIELFAAFVEHNLLEFHQVADDKSAEIAGLQKDLDLWLGEHAQGYFDGIAPIFSRMKARQYDSFWNWARQDVFLLFNDILFGRLVSVNRDVASQCYHVMNRASPELITFMEDLVTHLPKLLYTEGLEESIKLTEKYSNMLIDNVKSALNDSPVYRDLTTHTRPSVHITNDGVIEYSEVRREGVNNFDAYAREMKTGSTKVAVKWRSGQQLPHVFIRDRSPTDHSMWSYDTDRSNTYLSVLADMATNGVSFTGRTALMTGCGKGSIGCDMLKGLLSGGARVVVTTSSFNRKTVDFFRSVYERHGARGSRLVVVPFNQGSVQDVKALIDYIYSSGESKGLGWDLDYVVPFAAISENGRELTDIDDKSELAHRIMLTNVLRLLGFIAKAKQERRIETRPAQVILPLSPNHGVFGGDGLYGESKIGLETLLNRWHSEHWNAYLSIVGAVIGWTRGTGLMNDNNIIAEGMEESGIRTFSGSEMAFNLLGLMHPDMVRMSETSPVYGDLNGGLDAVANLAEFTKKLRTNLSDQAKIKRAMAKERSIEGGLDVKTTQPIRLVTPRANMKFEYPSLKPTDKLPGNPLLKDLLDLDKVVVVTGFSEVGPWGNSRTRWEMEAYGEFSLEGCIEMAWIMGLITFSSADAGHTGWIDAKSKEPVADHEIKAKYEQQILEHSGIRLIEPELFNGYDPNKKGLAQEVIIDFDMAPLEVSKEEADQFKLQHGSKADVYESDNGNWLVRLRRGAAIYVPKALRFDRLVAGQIPTGWDAARYGLPKDIIDQVDPITLYVLVATVEALVSAGVTDPYEFYQYVHVAEVGNTSGGGEGGMLSNRGLYLNRFLDKPVAKDVLQESFINTMPAWVNLLLLSSSGPIKTPVGACATAVESVEIGVDTIQSGKARVVIVGGYDDFQEESSYEFANMKATSSSVDEFAKGRQPDEMSRPTTTSRSGFMESQGSGIQVLMCASLALEMGCPIYGIVALTNTATDKEGRSIPAPGQGILTTARSVRPSSDSVVAPRVLDINYRHKRVCSALAPIRDWFEEEIHELEQEAMQIQSVTERQQFVAMRSTDIELERARREKQEKSMWGMDFWKSDHRIASIEGALAVYNLTVNDIGVASFHGTSTKANDLNESEVVNVQLEHLGRTPGNVLPCVFQKYLTGHPKGAAAAWMMNGALQILNTGVIPGNRNADNIDEKLEPFRNLLYLSRSVHTTGVRAAILKSFGFGQVGGEVLLIHPDYLYSALSEDRYASYTEHRASRQAKTYRYLQDVHIGNSKLVAVKSEAPYSSELESKVYLNPAARATFNPVKNSWAFDAATIDAAAKNATFDASPAGLNMAIQGLVDKTGGGSDNAGVGIDVQLIKDLSIESEAFIERNFTADEVEYCRQQPHAQSSFAGRWAAKEAVFKSICNANEGNDELRAWKTGAGGALKDIEILSSGATGSGAPFVKLHGDVATRLGGIPKVSISHSGDYAVAISIIPYC